MSFNWTGASSEVAMIFGAALGIMSMKQKLIENNVSGYRPFFKMLGFEPSNRSLFLIHIVLQMGLLLLVGNNLGQQLAVIPALSFGYGGSKATSDILLRAAKS